MSFEALLERKYLIFSGGGVRGAAYIGALAVLGRIWQRNDQDIRTHWKGAGGSSVGAIFALFIVLRLSVDEIMAEMQQFRPQIHGSADVALMYSKFGLYSTEVTETWLRGVLRRHVNDPDITFEELARVTDGRELRVCLTNLSKCMGEVHDAQTTPHAIVWKSIVASTAIPILFAPQTIGDEYFCDGGVACNFPTFMFAPSETIGMCLLRQSAHASKEIVSFQGYLGRVMSSLASPEVPSDMLVVDIKSSSTIAPFTFNPDDAQVQETIEQGIMSALLFLQQQSPPNFRNLVLINAITHIKKMLWGKQEPANPGNQHKQA
jgi:predicted acylesterase/phospholipase RssA